MNYIQILIIFILFVVIIFIIDLIAIKIDRYKVYSHQIDEKFIFEQIDYLQKNTKRNYNGIPKIIHHIAPSDIKKWKKDWIECFPSWYKIYPTPEYNHIMWNDENDLRDLIKNNFEWFLPIYDNYKEKIMKIDTVRYFILYQFGGIYADLDIKCFKNFYNFLDPEKISIVESPSVYTEFLQNSLMISPKNHHFWLEVIKEAVISRKMCDVLDVSGPRLLDRTLYKYPEDINVLKKKYFNPGSNKYFKNKSTENNNNLYTHHLHTGSWTNPLKYINYKICRKIYD
ncbi:DXD sugar-binding motif protein [uncultured virus]|nr:DXD sugar-binding motif protein [uncultured virus]